VSDNGGAFTGWLVGTALTSSSYTGVAGHTYAFYSEAIDAAGNVEQKTTADTSTTVNANAAGCGGSPGLSIAKTHTGNFTVNQNGSFSITVSNSGTAATSSTITVSDMLPSGLGFVSANGTGWSCMNNSGNVVCTNTAPIGASSNAVITLTVSVTTNLTSIQNTASVTGGGGSIVTGSSTDTVTVLQGPSTSTQPLPQTACSGASVSFTAAATGSPTPTVQWQVSTNGGATFTNLTGATSTTLTFTSAASQNNNQYRAVFTNTAGSSNTNAVLLTVNTAPAITLNPLSQPVTSGQTATFTAGASGQPTPTVQWQVSTNGGTTFSNIAGATSTTLSFTTGTGQSGNQYRAVFTSSCGGATTTAATLTVSSGPTVVSFNVLFGTVGNYAMIGSTRSRLPWEITGVQVTFSEPITTGNINSLSGTGITTTRFAGLGTTTLTWTIGPLALGKFTATLAGSGTNSLKDSMGNALGLGAGYSQNLKILWGDFNDDGTVNAQDEVLVNQARARPYNQFADMNGDGVVNVLDVQIVAQRNGTNQP
jgi:uncharacterized repeat protein (TIGR01451 family)